MKIEQTFSDCKKHLQKVQFQKKVERFLQLYLKAPKIGMIVEHTSDYMTLAEMIIKVKNTTGIELTHEIIEQFIIGPIVEDSDKIKKTRLGEIVTDNVHEMLAPVVLKRDDKIEFLLNASYCEAYLECITFLLIEYYLQLSPKVKVEDFTLRNIEIVYDNVARLYIPLEKVEVLYNYINALHQSVNEIICGKTCKLFRKIIYGHQEKTKESSVRSF